MLDGLLIVARGWLAIMIPCCLLAALIWLVERVTGRQIADIVSHWLGRPTYAERRLLAMCAEDDAESALLVEEHIRQEEARYRAHLAADPLERAFQAEAAPDGIAQRLERAFALPPAPNPKLLYVSGTVEERLRRQRAREREAQR